MQVKQLLADQSFYDFGDRDSSAVFENICFERCEFNGCVVSWCETPSRRSTIKNCDLIDCKQRGSSLDAAVVEDVTVHHFNTNGQLFTTWGAVFKHVTLKGQLGKLMCSDLVGPLLDDGARQQAFSMANAAFYERVDWALDISAAEFVDVDLRGVPANLVRRDPETQAIFTRAQAIAMQSEWEKLELQENLFLFTMDSMLKKNASSGLLIAPKKSKKFKRLMADLKTLRRAGFANVE
jgi:uncharacterized protein YjbI with pentapeptide repeats